MKKNKTNLLILSMILAITMIGCKPANKNMRNLSTQTRITEDNVNNRWMNNTAPLNTRDNLNTNLNRNLNNGMVRNDNVLDDGMLGNGTINNNTNRFNTSLTDNTSTSGLSQRASTIAQRVTALPDVNTAHVLINGNTAIVGIDTNGNTNTTITDTLKQKIVAAVKVADKNIKNVSVTADPSIFTRIRTMSLDMNNTNTTNNPIKNFTSDMEDIMRQITNVR